MNPRTVRILIASLALALLLAACADPGRVTALEAQRDELQARVTTLESTVEDLEASLEGAEAARQEAEARATELEASLAEARAAADEAAARRDTLRSEVDRLESIAGSLREGQESDLETQLALIESLLSRAGEDVTALTGRQTVLRDRLGLPEPTGDTDGREPADTGTAEPTSEDAGTTEPGPAPDSDEAPREIEEAPADDAATPRPGEGDGEGEGDGDGNGQGDQEPAPDEEETEAPPMGA